MGEKKSSQAFEVKDCALITKMAGLYPAMNIRELYFLLKRCSDESLFHHFCELPIRASFNNPEFRNDFAIWSYLQLRDRIMAERLGIINPYSYNSMDDLREYVLDLIRERVSELHHIPSVPLGEEFRFMEAATWVFDAHMTLHTPNDLINSLPTLSDSSIYYHFIESRRRTQDRSDDFSIWLRGKGELADDLSQRFERIDFYSQSLQEIKSKLIQTSQEALMVSPSEEY